MITDFYSLPFPKGGLEGMSISLRIKGLDRLAERGEAGIPLKSNIFLSPQPHKPYSLLHILRRGVADQVFFVAGASACICPKQQKKTNDLKSRSPQTFVRIKGLEPPRLSASDPKSDVATNYTISASEIRLIALFHATKVINLFNLPPLLRKI